MLLLYKIRERCVKCLMIFYVGFYMGFFHCHAVVAAAIMKKGASVFNKKD